MILNTRLEQRTMSQEMMDELRKSQEALKEELNLLKSQMRWVLETLQVLLRKEGHPIYTAATKRATTPHPSGVTPSQGKFYVATPHLPVYGPPSRRHHQHPLAIAPQSHQSQVQNKNQNQNKRNKDHNDSIPVPYSKLYPQLIQNALVTPRALTPVSPYLPWYNPNATCEFHKGALGHDLDSCLALKALVRELINKKSLVFEEDHPKVKCGYHTGTMGHSIEECKSFKLKLQRLIDIRSPTLKEEGSGTYTLISGPGNEKGKGPLRPLKVLYHKEDVRDVANELSLFPGKSIEIPSWISNVTTHTNERKGEVSSGSKRVAFNDEIEGKEFEDHHANVKKLVDPNLQV